MGHRCGCRRPAGEARGYRCWGDERRRFGPRPSPVIPLAAAVLVGCLLAESPVRPVPGAGGVGAGGPVTDDRLGPSVRSPSPEPPSGVARAGGSVPWGFWPLTGPSTSRASLPATPSEKLPLGSSGSSVGWGRMETPWLLNRPVPATAEVAAGRLSCSPGFGVFAEPPSQHTPVCGVYKTDPPALLNWRVTEIGAVGPGALAPSWPLLASLAELVLRTEGLMP